MMKAKTTVLAALLAVLFASVSVAAEKKTLTTINVQGMHCAACAKKITDQLKQVPGVTQSLADANKGLAIAVPVQGNKLPSPRAQWDAVEKAGFKPIKLAGPFGVFTSRPKF